MPIDQFRVVLHSFQIGKIFVSLSQLVLLANDIHIREALKKAGKVGLGQLTIQGREHLGVIVPIEKKGLLLLGKLTA